MFRMDPKFVSNFSIAVFNDSDFISRINWTMLIKEDLQEMIFSITYRMIFNDKTGPQTFRAKLDFCKIANGATGSFPAKNIVEMVAEYSNFRFTCPVKKGFYYARNFPVFDLKAYPVFFMRPKSTRIEWESTTNVRVKGKAGIKVMGTIRIYGATLF
jgi:Protein of unknown function (DUF1091)